MKKIHFLRCDFSAEEIEEALEQALEQAVKVVNSGARDTPDMTIRAEMSGQKRKE